MDWNQYVPFDGDPQNSMIMDTLACGSFSAVHIAEMLERKWTGSIVEYSERALAKLSGTNHNGNSLSNIANAINNYGLIKTEDWPELTDGHNNVSWDEYYAEIPPEVLKRADKGWKCSLTKLNPSQVVETLKVSPVWTIIDVGTIDHIVAQLSQGDGQFGLGMYFDSYLIYIKNFQPAQPIVSQWFLKLTYTPMTNSDFYHKIGTSEYGFTLPALNEDALRDKALNLGKNIFKADGSIDYDSAKQVSGL